MSRSELPPGWGTTGGASGVYYSWSDPKFDGTPDIYISEENKMWSVNFWIRNLEKWITMSVPLTPDPPFEVVEALYYAAQ